MPTINTMDGIRRAILPGVWALTDRAQAQGVPIVSADVFARHDSGNIMLGVEYELLSRQSIENGGWKDSLGTRLDAALRMFAPSPQGKALAVERRRMRARASVARAAKVRRK